MDQAALKADTRHTLKWNGKSGRERPLNIHVYRVYEKLVNVRETSDPGPGRKVACEDIIRIVHETPVGAGPGQVTRRER